MMSDALREAVREARGEAAPFVALAMIGFIALALVSQDANWQLVHGVGWWVWLIAAAPYGALALIFAMGLGQNRTYQQRRAAVTVLLGIIVSLTVVETGLLIASLVEPSNLRISGPQLLMSAVVLWVSNVIAFGLAIAAARSAAHWPTGA